MPSKVEVQESSGRIYLAIILAMLATLAVGSYLFVAGWSTPANAAGPSEPVDPIWEEFQNDPANERLVTLLTADFPEEYGAVRDRVTDLVRQAQDERADKTASITYELVQQLRMQHSPKLALASDEAIADIVQTTHSALSATAGEDIETCAIIASGGGGDMLNPRITQTSHRAAMDSTASVLAAIAETNRRPSLERRPATDAELTRLVRAMTDEGVDPATAFKAVMEPGRYLDPLQRCRAGRGAYKALLRMDAAERGALVVHLQANG